MAEEECARVRACVCFGERERDCLDLQSRFSLSSSPTKGRKESAFGKEFPGCDIHFIHVRSSYLFPDGSGIRTINYNTIAERGAGALLAAFGTLSISEIGD